MRRVVLTTGAEVTLRRADQDLARWAGAARYERNRRAGTTGEFLAATPLDGEITGVGAEIAFVRLARLVLPKLVLDANWVGSPDCTLPNGWTVDVKNTNSPRQNIYAKRTDYATIFVSTTGTVPTYRFLAWVERDVLIHPDHWNWSLSGWRYCMGGRHSWLHRELVIAS